jgi:hypothetical protein
MTNAIYLTTTEPYSGKSIIAIGLMNLLSGCDMNSHVDTKLIFDVFAPGANKMEFHVYYVDPLMNFAKSVIILSMKNK